MIDLDDIKNNAEAATKGKWELRDNSLICVPNDPWGPDRIAYASGHNAEHIVSVSPDVVLQMIERIRNAEKIMYILLNHFVDKDVKREAFNNHHKKWKTPNDR